MGEASDILERPTSFPWPPVLLVGTIAAGFALGRLWPLPWTGTDDLPARIIGTGFGAAGLAIILWAVVTLRRHRTTILPDKGATTLVTEGPYRFRRNPMYVGWVLVILCLAELTKNIWLVGAALLFALLVTRLAILPEERHLEAKFGDVYREYKARTRRWI